MPVFIWLIHRQGKVFLLPNAKEIMKFLLHIALDNGVAKL